jgi:hypothetical protein
MLRLSSNYFPAAGPYLALEILERSRDFGVARGFVNSDATNSEATGSESSERGDSCRTE